MPAPPRRVELIRVSSVGQAAKDTPADQREALDKLRRDRPCIVVERIEDGAEGLSGALPFDQRPDLQRLEKLSQARAYDELAVRHTDRLTRTKDLGERWRILDMVQKAGAIIVTASGKEIDPNTIAGQLMWTVEGHGNAEERIKIMERATAGKKRAAASGFFLGRSPYGRRWNPKAKNWSLVEGELSVYRRIFAEVIGGASLYDLASRLNAEGTPSPGTPRKGNKRTWRASTVAALLHSRTAIGEVSSMGVKLRCPEVVDQVTWQRAKKALRSPGRKGRPAKTDLALFRGRLVCGACGSAVWVQYGTSRGNEYWWYVCRHFRTARTEECRTRHQVKTADMKGRQSLLGWLAAKVAPKAKLPDPGAQIAELQHKLRDLEDEEERVLLLGRQASTRAREKAMAKLAEERAETEAQLVDLRQLSARAKEPGLDQNRKRRLLALAQQADTRQLRELVLSAFRRGDFVLSADGSVTVARDGDVRPEN